MKRIIVKVIQFFILGVIVITVLAVGSNYIIKSKAQLNLDKDIKHVFVGHSHSQCSVNDNLINNSINLSASGEAYLYNLRKLERIVETNPNIETVFIEFANNNIDSVMDSWLWGYDKMSFYLQFYSPFMEREDFELMAKNNSTDLIASYSIATRKHLYRIARSNYDMIDEFGGYLDTGESKVNEFIKSNNLERTISKSLALSNDNLNYLRKMIEVCRAQDIKVFLIRSPQHELHPDKENESLYQKVLNDRFNDVELLDFDEMYFPNEHYLDLHHLNNKGAKKFSLFLNDLIQNGLIESNQKQKVISEAISAFNDNSELE